MTLTPPSTDIEPKPSLILHQKCGQRLSDDGKILVSKKGWITRIATLVGISLVIVYNLQQGLELGDSLVVYSTLMPIHALAILVGGWFFYRNNTNGEIGNDLVSVIIPVYNQESMIEFVIDAIYQSTYKNIEVIAINDGSKDGTKNILGNLMKKYTRLKVINKKNEGKRKAVASGFYESKGKYVVLIDSDSIIERHSIVQFVKAFHTDPKIGAAVGHVKVWNANKSVLTRCQDAWYDFSFNIQKAFESFFGSVFCCSGCLAAYRREAIAGFIPYWAESKLQFSDDRQLTSYVIAPPTLKTELRYVFGENKFWSPLSQKLMESTARYDDAEDRGLTAHTLVNWKSVYIASAIAYTAVPEKWKDFLKQQVRWKKGTVRTNFFVSAFFWRKNPLIALVFYIEFMITFTAPLILFIVFFYEPFVLHLFWLPVIFLAGKLLLGLAAGFDYKFRDPNAKNWVYKPLMNLIVSFALPWLLIPALWTLRKNQWLTR